MQRFVLGCFLLVVSATAVFGFQSQFFLDEKGGFFRLDFSTEEFQGVTADSLTVIPDNEGVFGLYKIDTSQLINAQSRVPENQWLYIRGNKDVQKLIRWEDSLEQELGRLQQRRKMLESVLEQEKKGEFSLDPIERSNVDNRIADLTEKEEPIGKRIAALRKERGDLEKKLVERFSDTKRRVFTEKPDFSLLGRWLPETREVRLSFHHARDGKVLMEIPLTFPDAPGGDQSLVRNWLKAQGTALERLGANTPGDSVFSYIQLQSAHRLFAEGKLDDPRKQDFFQKRPGQGFPDLYSILSGALAIQESLQLDRMTGTTDHAVPGIPIKRLSGPHVKSHPYAEMIGARVPKTLPIDDLVPADFYSCHFSDVNKALALSDLLEQWGTSFLQTIRVSAHDAQARQRYLRQLCLNVSELTRLFGEKAIADLTICGADPFLHEGTDLSVIFSVRNKALFELHAAAVAGKAKADFPDCREDHFVRDGVNVRVLRTSDSRIRSYSCFLGDFAVYSNSRRAVEMIIDTFHKKNESIGQAMDYRYMRTIFPDGGEEDAFAFLSDSHIRRLVSPTWKIARQRRLQCVNSLRILQNALALYGSEHGPKKRAATPPTLEMLIKEGFVDPAYLVCPDGGTYSLQGSAAAPQCSHHGRLRFLAPILDEQPTLVTDQEWEQYRKFVAEFNAYWARFFDPIGIRGQIPPADAAAGEKRDIILETCILPLLQNSVYDGFKRFSAGTPARMDMPTHPNTILQLLAKINFQDLRSWDATFERFFHSLTEETSLTGNELVDALGESFSINIVDDDLRFMINLEGAGPLLGMIGLFRDPVAVLAGNILLTGLNMPTYVVVALRDDKKVERFIRDWLRRLAQHSALVNRNPDNQPGMRIFTYETASDHDGQMIHSLDMQFYVMNLHFFFAVRDGNLIIANQRDIVTKILANQDERTQAETNLAFRVNLRNFKRVSPTAHLLWQERMRAVCRNNLGTLLALSRFHGVAPGDWWERSLDINGYSPFCPAGGKYSLDASRDTVCCSVHGDILSPRQPFKLDMSAPLNAFVDSLTGIEASLAFTTEGIMTRVRLGR